MFAEQADLTDLAALLDDRRAPQDHRDRPPGRVGAVAAGRPEPVDGARQAIASLLNVIEAGARWEVTRVGLASTIGVYGGVAAPSPLGEDLPLPMTAGHVIPVFKKIGELLGDYLAGAAQVEVVNYRIGAIWGPGGRAASAFFALPRPWSTRRRGARRRTCPRCAGRCTAATGRTCAT